MAPVRVIVYDIEIAKAIPDGKQAPDPNVQYCRGWKDFGGMGIAVLCAIEIGEMVPRVFLQDNLLSFLSWSTGAILAGHSNRGFDDPILEAMGLWQAAGSYDILRALRVAVGESPDYRPGVTKGGRKVDDLARVNLNGMQKSMGGDLAPLMWQRGAKGHVIDYCLRDVAIETQLFLRRDQFVDPVTGRTVCLAEPSLEGNP